MARKSAKIFKSPSSIGAEQARKGSIMNMNNISLTSLILAFVVKALVVGGYVLAMAANPVIATLGEVIFMVAFLSSAIAAVVVIKEFITKIRKGVT